MNPATTDSHPRKSAFRNSAELPKHPSSAPLSPQTPSLPDAAPRSHRPRCAGRESNFLAETDRARATGVGERHLEPAISLSRLGEDSRRRRQGTGRGVGGTQTTQTGEVMKSLLLSLYRSQPAVLAGCSRQTCVDVSITRRNDPTDRMNTRQLSK